MMTAERTTPAIDCAEHMGLVWYVARRWIGYQQTFDLDELVSITSLALVVAAEKFDPSQNTKFVTFAMPRLNGAIKDALRSWNKCRPDRDHVQPKFVPIDDPDAKRRECETSPRWEIIEQAIESLSPDRARLARRIVYDGATTKELQQEFTQWAPGTVIIYRAEVRRAIAAYISEAA